MERIKTAKQMKREAEDAARNLPTETKRKFWHAMIMEGKNLGEARVIAGIDDIMVAAELVIQCHSTYHLPMRVDDIQ